MVTHHRMADEQPSKPRKKRTKPKAEKPKAKGRAPRAENKRKKAKKPAPDLSTHSTALQAAIMGRPTDYRPEYGLEIITHMAFGFSLTATAGIMGFSRQTFHNWAEKYPDFLDSVGRAKALRTYALELGLLHAPDGPTVTARIFALKNAAPEEWREKQEIEHTGDGDPLARLYAAICGHKIMPDDDQSKFLNDPNVLEGEFSVLERPIEAGPAGYAQADDDEPEQANQEGQ
jgi:hypothetical protein